MLNFFDPLLEEDFNFLVWLKVLSRFVHPNQTFRSMQMNILTDWIDSEFAFRIFQSMTFIDFLNTL